MTGGMQSAELAGEPGRLLGGRVIYRQLVQGYRTGLEPILMAAFVRARAEERVIEAGAGAGAALLSLSARVPGILGLGLEIRPDLTALARENAAANGFASLEFLCTDVTSWRSAEKFDHAMANPPWHDVRGSVPGDMSRQTAKFAAPAALPAWVKALSRGLRHRGTLTLMLPAAQLGRAAAALEAAGCAETTLFPLWPRAGAAARLVLLQGVKNGKGACRLLPGLVLHQQDGALSAAAEAILRGGDQISVAACGAV